MGITGPPNYWENSYYDSYAKKFPNRIEIERVTGDFCGSDLGADLYINGRCVVCIHLLTPRKSDTGPFGAYDREGEYFSTAECMDYCAVPPRYLVDKLKRIAKIRYHVSPIVVLNTTTVHNETWDMKWAQKLQSNQNGNQNK